MNSANNSTPVPDVQGKAFAIGQKVARNVGSHPSRALFEMQEVFDMCETRSPRRQQATDEVSREIGDFF